MIACKHIHSNIFIYTYIYMSRHVGFKTFTYLGIYTCRYMYIYTFPYIQNNRYIPAKIYRQTYIYIHVLMTPYLLNTAIS